MRWFSGSIVEAVTLSKSRNAIFVVYVEGTDAQSKAMTELIDSPEVVSRLSAEDNFLAIKIISGSETYTQFAQIYQLVPVPSVFFIGSNGTPLEVFAGSSANLSGLISRIDSLAANKGGKVSSPTQMTHAPSSSSSAASTAAFLSSEQGAIPKTSGAKTADGSKPAPAEETELVCEGEVCTRRPKPASPVSPAGDTPPSPSAAASAPAPSSGQDAESQRLEQLSVDEKVQRAKELIEKKKKEKMEEERKAEREKELERRAQGAGMAELKRWQQEQELKNLKEERLKEKKENDLIRARILEQIAQDRADRQARFGGPVETPVAASSPTTVTPPSPAVDTGSVTRIQFKMADGSTHMTQVDSDSTLGDLRQYAKDNIEKSGNFSLSVAYPRRCLSPSEDGQSLRALGLSPSSALLLLRAGPAGPSQVDKAGGFFGMLTQIFWSMIGNPVGDLFRYVGNLISGQRDRSRSSPPPRNSRRTQQQDESSAKKRRVGGGSDSGASGTSTVRREGNTYRLKDRDSDDENNTWNGNSTQQM